MSKQAALVGCCLVTKGRARGHLKLLEGVVFIMQGLKASLDGGLVQRELSVKLHSLGKGV